MKINQIKELISFIEHINSDIDCLLSIQIPEQKVLELQNKLKNQGFMSMLEKTALTDYQITVIEKM